ncbi:hypothetical protein [Stakelama pacifica]|uniref:Uncharacterized protein n=1 Tax=Stakelama pacifica TaxID=517720 RepID=A0A4R6FVE7_9SPHN|nr:hypothetical protein [Stakelama pacifica]TDN85707.1 hypothetical protein EV664_102417 [Stakelama pacifica]GGO91864.1 hypothetical protein GCM10011329_07550 [Stakelama pacifica]
MPRIIFSDAEIVDLPVSLALAGAIGGEPAGDGILEIIVAVANG